MPRLTLDGRRGHAAVSKVGHELWRLANILPFTQNTPARPPLRSQEPEGGDEFGEDGKDPAQQRKRGDGEGREEHQLPQHRHENVPTTSMTCHTTVQVTPALCGARGAHVVSALVEHELLDAGTRRLCIASACVDQSRHRPVKEG